MNISLLKWCNFVKKPAFRYLCSTSQKPVSILVENVSVNRSLLRVSGDQVESFLQGLITNDINHVSQSANSSMYTMFLNKPGRILYDSIVFKKKDEKNTFYIECDSTVDNSLKQHLEVFRVRKKIDINIVRDEFDIWVAFQEKPLTEGQKEIQDECKAAKKFVCFLDPRLNLLGTRIITTKGLTDTDFKALWPNRNVLPSTDSYDYIQHRYALGVSEGIVEIPTGKCFPFEANCDYLHGISFHKGCYLGQEFTARTYHTGVVRKRIMPIRIDDSYSKSEKSHEFQDAPIVNEDSQPVGKLRGIKNQYAIGVLKVEVALKSKALTFNNINGTTLRPNWWPQLTHT